MEKTLQLKKPRELRNSVLNWLETLRIKDAPYGTYKMSRNSDASMFSSCYSVFVRKLYGDLDSVTSKQQTEWIDLIRNCQDRETGLFIDSGLKKEGKFSETLGKEYDWGYVTWQLTTFCISALETLGGEIKYQLKFLEKWKKPNKVVLWLDSLDWKKGTWTNGNMAMFLGVCLITGYEKNKSKETKDALDAFFDWHDSFQDPKTGFWGTDHGTPIDIGLFAAMHQFLLYYYTKRPLKYMDKIIDNTLYLQQPDGLFSSGGGGNCCEDLDAIETLVNMYKRINYRREDIEAVLQKALIATLNLYNEKEGGGFLLTGRQRFGVKDWCKIAFSIFRHQNLRYWYHSCLDAMFAQFITYHKPHFPKGWTTTGWPYNESDILSTWFRSLNIALISQVLTDNPYAEIGWKFLKIPGLGFFDKDI